MPPTARRRSKPSAAAPRRPPRATHQPRGSGRTDRASTADEAAPERRKLVAFDAATWQALDLLAHDSMKDFQELADEAFRDLLKKHGRPTDLKTALRRSLGPRHASGKARG